LKTAKKPFRVVKLYQRRNKFSSDEEIYGGKLNRIFRWKWFIEWNGYNGKALRESFKDWA